MNRNTRAEKAQETLKIIEQGYYTINGITVKIVNDIRNSINDSTLYRTEEFEKNLQYASDKIPKLQYNTEIKVVNTTVLKAAHEMSHHCSNVGCLNFASAKNPGGGFLGGAMAQEESLALSSTLYPTLMQHFEMYEFNRGLDTYLYSDYMIYSPEVTIIRNDDGDLLPEPYKVSFITSPAVNVGAMKNNRPEEMAFAEATMLRRMDKIFATFLSKDIEHLLLGAWGCGVFQNDPQKIASWFGQHLLSGGKYEKCFKSVVFAVLDRSKNGENITAFNSVFDKQFNNIL